MFKQRCWRVWNLVFIRSISLDMLRQLPFLTLNCLISYEAVQASKQREKKGLNQVLILRKPNKFKRLQTVYRWKIVLSTSVIRREIWSSDEVSKARASAAEEDSNITLSSSSAYKLALHAWNRFRRILHSCSSFSLTVFMWLWICLSCWRSSWTNLRHFRILM